MPYSTAGAAAAVELGTCIEQEVYTNDSETSDGSNSFIRCTIQIQGTDHDDAVSVDLPEKDSKRENGSLASQLWPASLASAILLSSPEFRSYVMIHNNIDEDTQATEEERNDKKKRMMIVELGSGRGLAGLIACEIGADCVLTDNDPEAVELLQRAVTLNNQQRRQQQGSLSTASARRMDWRDSEIDDGDETQDQIRIPVDMVFGSDIAYYWYLLRPIMDTTRRLFGNMTMLPSSSSSPVGRSSVLFMNVGQANRESQWDLYKNIRDGCYNQLTDEHDPPWDGATHMILYRLQMSKFCETLDECDTSIEGTVPIAVLRHHDQHHHQSIQVAPPIPFASYAHFATDEDDSNILKSF